MSRASLYNEAHSVPAGRSPDKGNGVSPETETLLIIFKQKRCQKLRIHFNFQVIARPMSEVHCFLQPIFLLKDFPHQACLMLFGL